MITVSLMYNNKEKDSYVNDDPTLQYTFFHDTEILCFFYNPGNPLKYLALARVSPQSP